MKVWVLQKLNQEEVCVFKSVIINSDLELKKKKKINPKASCNIPTVEILV